MSAEVEGVHRLIAGCPLGVCQCPRTLGWGSGAGVEELRGLRVEVSDDEIATRFALTIANATYSAERFEAAGHVRRIPPPPGHAIYPVPRLAGRQIAAHAFSRAVEVVGTIEMGARRGDRGYGG